MALITCPECNHQVSTEAQFCPGCGTPDPSGTRREAQAALADQLNRQSWLANAASGMQACGCILTLFVTLPILFIVFALLFA